MTRWEWDLGEGWTVYVDADGWGVVIGPDGEAEEINDHEHAVLFVKAHKYGIQSRVREEEGGGAQ